MALEDIGVHAGAAEKPRECYQVFAETLFHPDIGRYDTYGISFDDGAQRACIHDISTYMDKVSHMAELFNRRSLSPVYFRDSVEALLE